MDQNRAREQWRGADTFANILRVEWHAIQEKFVAIVGDSTIEHVEWCGGRGQMGKQQQSGIGVQPNAGHWSYLDYQGEIWLSEGSDVFAAIRVDSDW